MKLLEFSTNPTWPVIFYPLKWNKNSSFEIEMLAFCKICLNETLSSPSQISFKLKRRQTTSRLPSLEFYKNNFFSTRDIGTPKVLLDRLI